MKLPLSRDAAQLSIGLLCSDVCFTNSWGITNFWGITQNTDPKQSVLVQNIGQTYRSCGYLYSISGCAQEVGVFDWSIVCFPNR